MKPYAKTPAKLARISALRSQGLSYREIGRRVGLTPSGVHNLCQRHGRAAPRVIGRRLPEFPGVVALARQAHERRNEAIAAYWGIAVPRSDAAPETRRTA